MTTLKTTLMICSLPCSKARGETYASMTRTQYLSEICSPLPLLHFRTFALLHFCTCALLHLCTCALLHFCTFATCNFALVHLCTSALLHFCTSALWKLIQPPAAPTKAAKKGKGGQLGRWGALVRLGRPGNMHQPKLTIKGCKIATN